MKKLATLALAAGLGLAAAGLAAPEPAQAGGRSFSLHLPGFGLHIGRHHGYVYGPGFYGYKRDHYRKRYRRKRHWRHYRRHRHGRRYWRRHYRWW